MPRPARGRVPSRATMAESASRKSGSATSAPNAGTANRRISASRSVTLSPLDRALPNRNRSHFPSSGRTNSSPHLVDNLWAASSQVSGLAAPDTPGSRRVVPSVVHPLCTTVPTPSTACPPPCAQGGLTCPRVVGHCAAWTCRSRPLHLRRGIVTVTSPREVRGKRPAAVTTYDEPRSTSGLPRRTTDPGVAAVAADVTVDGTAGAAGSRAVSPSTGCLRRTSPPNRACSAG